MKYSADIVMKRRGMNGQVLINFIRQNFCAQGKGGWSELEKEICRK